MLLYVSIAEGTKLDGFSFSALIEQIFVNEAFIQAGTTTQNDHHEKIHTGLIFYDVKYILQSKRLSMLRTVSQQE
jgi:hypothetical protein